MAKSMNVGKMRLKDRDRRYEEIRSDARKKLAGLILGALMDGVHVYVLVYHETDRKRGERYINNLFRMAGPSWSDKRDFIHVYLLGQKTPRAGFGVFLEHLI